MKNAAKTKPASLKALQNALDRQEAYTKYGFTTEAEIKALQEKEVAAALAAHQAASAAYRGVVGASDANADTYRDAARAAYAAYQAAVAAYDAAALAEAEQATPSAAPSLTFKQVKAKRAAERTASAKRIAAAHAEISAVVATGTCPFCGAGLKRNLSIAGWWQCEQLGAESHRKNPALPSCSWQGFTC